MCRWHVMLITIAKQALSRDPMKPDGADYAAQEYE